MPSDRLEGALKGLASAAEASPRAARAEVAARAASAFAPSADARDRLRAARRPPAKVSTIEKDAEVGAFLRELFKARISGPALHAACLERFGAARTPSMGRIYVFRERVRLQWRTR